MIDDTNKSIVNTLNADLSTPTNFNKSSVQYQNKIQSKPSGLSAIADVLGRKYAESAEEQRQQAIKQKASDKLTGDVLSAAGEPVPVGASKATSRAWAVSEYTKEASKALRTITATFDDDDRNKMSDEDIKKLDADVDRALIHSLRQAGVGEYDEAKQFAVDSIRALQVHRAAARDKYYNNTLPTMTMGNITEGLVTSNASEKVWSKGLDTMMSDHVVGQMDTDAIYKTVYGNVLRATEGGSLSAFPAVKKSKAWERFTPRQQTQLQTSYEQELAEDYRTGVKRTSEEMITELRNIAVTGDASVMQQQEEKLAAIAKTNPVLASDLRDSTQRARDNAVPVVTTLTKLKRAVNPRLGIKFNPEESKLATDLLSRKYLSKGNSTQKSVILAVTEAMQLGIRTDIGNAQFNIMDEKMSGGKVTIYGQEAIDGYVRLHNMGKDDRDRKQIVGKNNYAILEAAYQKIKAGKDVPIAIGEVLDTRRNYDNADATSKHAALLTTIGEIDTAGVLDTVASVLQQTNDWIPSWAPFTDLENWDSFTRINKPSIDDATEIPVEDTSMIYKSVSDGVGIKNRPEMIAELQQHIVDNPTLTPEEAVESFVNKTRVISNRSSISNPKAIDALTGAINSDVATTSKVLSKVAKQIMPLSFLTNSEKSIVQDTITDVKYIKDGVATTATGAERARLLALHAENPIEGLELVINIDKYHDIFNEGLTTSTGRTIAPLYNLASKFVGKFDSGELSSKFTNHHVRYSESMNGFVFSGLSRFGNDLILEKDVQDTTIVNGVAELSTPELREGNPVVEVFDMEFVKRMMIANHNKQVGG